MPVSVVIPSYNCGPFVAEAVHSVLSQTQPPDEVIVVDDGSKDDTAERMAVFGSPVRYIRKENGGVSSARNRGIAEATGDLIAFLDADDVWHPRKMEIQLAVLKARPKLGLLAASLYDWPGAIPEVPPNPAEDFEDISLDDLIVRNSLATTTIVVRRDVIRAAGPFDERLRGPEDRDMWLRMARIAPFAKLRLGLAGYRAATPGSLSKNAAQMEAGLRLILHKLEAEGAFRGRPLLRRKAWGFFRYSCGHLHHLAGERRTATGHLALSLLGYPLPYPSADVRYSFGRLRLLAATLLKPGFPATRAL